MMFDPPVTGGCQCGAVRFRFTETKARASICHCRMCQKAFGSYFAPLVAVAADGFAITRGEPSFWLFVVLIAAVLFFQQMLIPNINAAAMRPLAEVAGTGAAILGMVSGTLGAVIGEVINRQFDGTITPLAFGFLISSLVAFSAWRWAEGSSR